ncbi:unnamed protein product [Clavelina lepadiformis]|uniref:Uncharacterized protein n=1 Tax=Clavelina lepadiformis TaxID=159417 RepID=A0ABP0GFC7_CLALP
MALLLACFILGAAVWYWWNQIRNSDGHHRQVTMVNMKTKSERGEGRGGRRLSRTTSINGFTMKNDAGKSEQLLNTLKKMSEDIIMEEITEDSSVDLAAFYVGVAVCNY